MIAREDVLASIEKALRLLEGRLGASPNYGVYSHANDQLRSMMLMLHSDSPDRLDRCDDWINLGLMAVRELEASDCDLANALMDVDYNFKNRRVC